jgi:hypothetical protein
MRLVTTCAPLKTQGYTSNYNDSDYGAVKRYMYGNTNISIQNEINFTYELPVDHIYRSEERTSTKNIPRLDYKVGSNVHYARNSRNRWTPIDALSVLDADVHIMFMSAPEI